MNEEGEGGGWNKRSAEIFRDGGACLNKNEGGREYFKQFKWIQLNLFKNLWENSFEYFRR